MTNITPFQVGKPCKSKTLINALVKLRGWQCECCGLSEWNQKKIPLCVHHVDGNPINNEEKNLKLLCYNCHAQTSNFCGKGRGKRKEEYITEEQFVDALRQTTCIRHALQKLNINYISKYYYEKAHYLIDKYGIEQKEPREGTGFCEDCGKPVTFGSLKCAECFAKSRRKVPRPDRDEFKAVIRSSSFESAGSRYGIASTTIRKWCDYYHLPRRRKDIISYSDEEWEKL